MQRLLNKTLSLILAVPALFGAAAVGQDIDWAIRNVDITDLGTELELRIVFHLDGTDLPEAVPFEVPISILLNGLSIEPDHIAAVTGLTPAISCPVCRAEDLAVHAVDGQHLHRRALHDPLLDDAPAGADLVLKHTFRP